MFPEEHVTELRAPRATHCPSVTQCSSYFCTGGSSSAQRALAEPPLLKRLPRLSPPGTRPHRAEAIELGLGPTVAALLPPQPPWGLLAEVSQLLLLEDGELGNPILWAPSPWI